MIAGTDSNANANANANANTNANANANANANTNANTFPAIHALGRNPQKSTRLLIYSNLLNTKNSEPTYEIFSTRIKNKRRSAKGRHTTCAATHRRVHISRKSDVFYCIVLCIYFWKV